MKNLIRFVFAGVMFTLILQSESCKKDALTKYETAVDNMVLFNDDSIALPVTVTAGDNCLLSAYNTSSGEMKFNLTGNDGKLIWQKQFEVKTISAILKENDGTFSVLSGQRLINIDVNGTVLKDVADAFPDLWDLNEIFYAIINKNNNYVLCGMYSNYVQLGFHRAFAAEYTHEGTPVFQKTFLDTATGVSVLSNYSTITGCEMMDDGGYLFFGNFYMAYWQGITDQIRFTITRTDKLGEIIWQKENFLVDSVPFILPPYSSQMPFSTNIYGFHPEAFTHEIMRTADGNYLLFLNMPDYSAPDQRARVYKIDPDGNTLDSAFIDFGKYNRFMGGLTNYFKIGNTKSYNCGNGVVRNADNTFSICMQNGFFGSKGLTTSYLGESHSFVVRIDQDLGILNTHNLQNYYTDCFTSACKSSDGRTVFFGLISSFGNSYKPALIFSNDN